MQDVLPDGGVIRKLWIGETDKYRDHLLRLDSASRHNRFGGGVSDDFIRNYRGSVDFARRRRAWLFHRRRDARRRGAAAAWRALSRARRKRRSAWRSRGKVTASARRCCAARCWPRATAAIGCCTWPVLPRTGACSSSRANSTPNLSFDFGSVVGEVESSRAQSAVGDAGTHGRRPRLRDSDARSAIADAAGVTVVRQWLCAYPSSGAPSG